jgi:hypothetical protein
MGYMVIPIAKTTANRTTAENIPATLPTYSIQDVFVGTVNISYGNPMADNALMKYDIPYQTYHCIN